MSNGVEFDEDRNNFSPRPVMTSGGYVPGNQTSNQPKMVQWLMKKGIVKSPAIGQVILVAIVIINIIITILVVNYFI